MGQAKSRGTFEQRRAFAIEERAATTAKLEAWTKEIETFRKEFDLDVGLIAGAPPEARIVVCRLDALKERLLKVKEG